LISANGQDPHYITYQVTINNCSLEIQGETDITWPNKSIDAYIGVYGKNKTSKLEPVPGGVLDSQFYFVNTTEKSVMKYGKKLDLTTLKFENFTLTDFTTEDNQYMLKAESSAGNLNQLIPIVIEHFVDKMGQNPLNQLLTTNSTLLADNFEFELDMTPQQDCFGNNVNKTLKMSCTAAESMANSVEVSYNHGKDWKITKFVNFVNGTNHTIFYPYTNQHTLFDIVNSTCHNGAAFGSASTITIVAALIYVAQAFRS